MSREGMLHVTFQGWGSPHQALVVARAVLRILEQIPTDALRSGKTRISDPGAAMEAMLPSDSWLTGVESGTQARKFNPAIRT
jgi:hypothetical protein